MYVKLKVRAYFFNFIYKFYFDIKSKLGEIFFIIRKIGKMFYIIKYSINLKKKGKEDNLKLI